MKSLQQAWKHIHNELTAAGDTLNKYENGMQLAIEERETILEEQRSIKSQLQILDEQLTFYNELVETKEGFPDGTRYILENPQEFSGVLGTVADMFQIEPDFRDALEAGLGDLSHCLIAKDKMSAISTLQKAREMQARDMTIIP